MLKIGNFGIGRIKKEQSDGVVIDLKNYSEELFGKFNPFSSNNYFNTFKTISEVQFPIQFICDRAKNANIVLKKWSDDSIVWDNKQINKFLEKPNPFYSFKDFISYYIQMKLVLGNAFVFANVNTSMTRSIWQYCDSYYILPTNKVKIETNKTKSIFFSDKITDLVKHYELSVNGWSGAINKIEPSVILHSRDFYDFNDSDGSLMSFSRLDSQKYTLANLVAVYEARNVIYTKRGALGAIVSKVGDASGNIPLEPNDKKELHEEFNAKYGLNNKKNLFNISRFPIDFIKFGATIAELEPFKETFNNAVQIAGIFGVNKELIPREGNSTFSNQNSAEISAYRNTIIPIVNTLLTELNQFLGLNDSGLYLDADWSDIDVLKEGETEQQRKKQIISERCGKDFRSGIITLNDWRVELGMEAIEKPLYKKTTIEMSETELNEIKNIFTI